MSDKLETISITRSNDQIKEPSGHCRKSARINQAVPQQPERPAFVAKSKWEMKYAIQMRTRLIMWKITSPLTQRKKQLSPDQMKEELNFEEIEIGTTSKSEKNVIVSESWLTSITLVLQMIFVH